MTSYDDRTSPTLLAKIRDLNNEDGWRRFVLEYKPMIVTWCERKGLRRDDAEDTASAVLEKLVRHMPQFQYDRSRSFRGWLYTVMTRAIVDARRETGKPGAIGSGDSQQHTWLANIAEDLTDDLSQKLEHDMLLVRTACLSVEQRVTPNVWKAFWLTAIEDRTGNEVAEQLGIKVASVFVYKNRVGKMVRSELELLGRTTEASQ